MVQQSIAVTSQSVIIIGISEMCQADRVDKKLDSNAQDLEKTSVNSLNLTQIGTISTSENKGELAQLENALGAIPPYVLPGREPSAFTKL